jgi:cobalt-zinc-cadmium efflux system outer membrane protein
VFEGKQSARPVPIPGPQGPLQHYAAYQTLEIPSERSARKRAAELARVSTRYAAESVELAAVAEAKHAFYGVLRQREEVQHALENLGLVRDLRRRVEVEVNTGEKGRLELTRAEAELARANFMVSSARINLVNAMAQLRVAIAAPASANLDPEGSLEPPVKLGTLDQLRAKVLQTHPTLEQARTDVEQAQAVLTHERALRIPQPTFFGEFERQPDLTFWRAGVTIPLPIWNRRQGQIAESQAAIRQMEAGRDQRTLEINAALERAYEQYQLADEQAKSLESGSLHEAESAVEAAKAAYRFGERGIVEVLDAQRVLQSVRGDLLDAQYARQSALVDLEELGAVTPGGKQ